MEDSRRWLNKQISRRNNLVVLNSTGFNEWGKLLSTYNPQSLILGYFVKDSFFIYHPISSTDRKEACTGVMADLIESFVDSVKPYCRYSEFQLIKKENFRNYDPAKSEGQTMVILFTRSYMILNKKLYKDVNQYFKENQIPYILLFGDFAVD
jgi:hypothetical protein